MDLLGLPAAARELPPAGRAIYACALAKHAGKADAIAHAWAWAAVEALAEILVEKGEPGAGDVHVDGPLGALIGAIGPRKKPKRPTRALDKLVAVAGGQMSHLLKSFPEFTASKHPHGVHGHWAPTEHPAIVDMTGAPALPKHTVASTANASEQKHFDMLHAHAMAGNLGALKTYVAGIKGTNTYAKHKQAYGKQLIQMLEEHHQAQQHAALAALKKPPTVEDAKAEHPSWNWDGPQQKATGNKLAAIYDLSQKGDLAGLKAYQPSKAGDVNPNTYAKAIKKFHAEHIAYHEQLAAIGKPATSVADHPAISGSVDPTAKETGGLAETLSEKPSAEAAGELSAPAPPNHDKIPSLSQAAAGGHDTGYFGVPLSLADMTKVSGQLGSNPGGKYEHVSGHEFYIKQSASNDHAKNEMLAAALYKAAGAPTLDYHPVDLGGGKLGVATQWQEKTPLNLGSAAHRAAAGQHFAAHAWLANWDAVGEPAGDNQAVVNGKMTTLDTGGALLYRAQGSPKGAAFGTAVPEWETMRDASKAPHAASVFGAMTPDELKASAQHVADVSDDTVSQLVHAYGPGNDLDKAALYAKLIARKQDLLKKAGIEETAGNPGASPKQETAPKTTATKPVGPGHNLPPLKVPKPPKFETKKPGIAEANSAVASQLHELATAADLKGLKAMGPNLPPQSEKLKAYHQDLLTAVDHHLNRPPPPPPQKPIAEAAPALNEIHLNHPPLPLSQLPGQKAIGGSLGRYAVLGEAPVSAIQAKTWQQQWEAGQHAPHKAAWTQLSNAEQGAISSYTGGGYSGMNAALTAAQVKGKAATAAKAVGKSAQPLEIGAQLSRKISLPSHVIEQFKNSVGKVIEDPSMASTSTNYNTWSGNVHMHLVAGPGVHGLHVGGDNQMGQHPGEQEVILPAGTRLHITHVEDGSKSPAYGAKLLVHAIILPNEGAHALVKALGRSTSWLISVWKSLGLRPAA